jgi:hypothetical protein
LLYKIWASLSGGAPIDHRGAEIKQSIEIQNSAKLSSEGAHRSRSSLSEEQKPYDDDVGGAADDDDDLEKSGKSNLEYAFGVGAVRDVAPKAKTPDYDPYTDFDDGFDRYDDD